MLPANAWVYNIKNELEFEPLKNLHYEDVWVHSGIGYREYDFNQLPKHLRLNDDIAQEIKARLIDFDLPVVHLRGTDREVSESKWAELRSAAPIAWVISDDKALIDRWMAESPDSKVFSNAKAGVNHLTEDTNKHEMILQLLTDFFAIASADTAYALSDDSLFFSMARLLGRIGGALQNPLLEKRKRMQELLIGQTLDPTGPVSVLPSTAEEKAKQIPEPATYHILCILPEADEKYDNGLIKSGQTMQYEELLSPVLFVVKIGPDAFKDEKRFPSGAACKTGDFILVRPNTGTRIKIHGQEFRIINDDSVQAVVQDPRGITRV